MNKEIFVSQYQAGKMKVAYLIFCNEQFKQGYIKINIKNQNDDIIDDKKFFFNSIGPKIEDNIYNRDFDNTQKLANQFYNEEIKSWTNKEIYNSLTSKEIENIRKNTNDDPFWNDKHMRNEIISSKKLNELKKDPVLNIDFKIDEKNKAIITIEKLNNQYFKETTYNCSDYIFNKLKKDVEILNILKKTIKPGKLDFQQKNLIKKMDTNVNNIIIKNVFSEKLNETMDDNTVIQNRSFDKHKKSENKVSKKKSKIEDLSI